MENFSQKVAFENLDVGGEHSSEGRACTKPWREDIFGDVRETQMVGEAGA